MKPWKSQNATALSAYGIGLQWGHGDEAVEEANDLNDLSPTIYGFNGATAMKPWKSCGCRHGFPPNIGFNGATAMKPWKRTLMTWS